MKNSFFIPYPSYFILSTASLIVRHKFATFCFMKFIRKAVIPAAGVGTRTLPASKAIPKEMITVVDRPSIQLVIEEAVAAGIEQIILVTARGKSAIDEHFTLNHELDAFLRARGKHELAEKLRGISKMADIILVRQHEALGLGHAILTAKNAVGDEPFAVMLPDDLFDCDPPGIKQLMDVAAEFNAPAVALLWVPNDMVNLYGMVHYKEIRDRVFKIWDMIEKPPVGKSPSNWSIVGRYVFPPEIFELIEKTAPGHGGEIQITDAIRALADKRDVLGVYCTGVRVDIGNLPGYIRAFLYYAMKNPEGAGVIKEFVKERKNELFG